MLRTGAEPWLNCGHSSAYWDHGGLALTCTLTWLPPLTSEESFNMDSSSEAAACLDPPKLDARGPGVTCSRPRL